MDEKKHSKLEIGIERENEETVVTIKPVSKGWTIAITLHHTCTDDEADMLSATFDKMDPIMERVLEEIEADFMGIP